MILELLSVPFLQKHLPANPNRDDSHQDHRHSRVCQRRRSSALLAIAEVDPEWQTLLAEGDVLLDGLVDALTGCDIKIREVVLVQEKVKSASWHFRRKRLRVSRLTGTTKNMYVELSKSLNPEVS